MKILPAPDDYERSARLLVAFSVAYTVAATGYFLIHLLELRPFIVSELLGWWLLFVALPVVALIGLVWAVFVKPADSP